LHETLHLPGLFLLVECAQVIEQSVTGFFPVASSMRNTRYKRNQRRFDRARQDNGLIKSVVSQLSAQANTASELQTMVCKRRRYGVIDFRHAA
jgi:hypothetical protein